MTGDTYDVVVIGAGISGTSSAKLLHEEGLNVLLLEARNRVGGRLYTLKDPSVDYVDLGGAYVGPTQNRILRMAKELGVETYCINMKGRTILEACGNKMAYEGSLPPIYNPIVALDLNNVIRTIDEYGNEVPLLEPWNCPKAKEWDSISTKAWLDEVCWTDTAKNVISILLHSIHACEPEELSLLYFLWYIKSGAGTLRISSTEKGAQERKFVGGSQQICEKIVDLIGKDKILYNSPVVKIEQNDDSVIVSTASGRQIKAQYVVSAVSPTLLNKISFDPPLSPLKSQLIQRVPMGSVIKTNLYYKTAFWREKGYCGMIASDGLVSAAFDDTKADGSHPSIIGLVTGNQARMMSSLTKQERKNKLCEFYAKVLDSDEALHPINYMDNNWLAEEYSGGCYVGLMPPGVLTQFGRTLRTPHGLIYFAGTETATEWAGYMDGGVQAGERAAREILQAMGRISTDEIYQDEPESLDVPEVRLEPSALEKILPSVSGVLRFVSTSAILIAVSAILLKNPGFIDAMKTTITDVFNNFRKN